MSLKERIKERRGKEINIRIEIIIEESESTYLTPSSASDPFFFFSIYRFIE